jgi:DNA helicase-2/ATP-dependent DNA helicase PcrA
MDYLSDLNPAQREAVTAPPGPILVLAGPGSGKTRVLTRRIVYRVDQLGATPGAIMAVTFTNKAAREMMARLDNLQGAEQTGRSSLRSLNIGTFHSLCARILRREAEALPFTHDFVIFDEADQRSLLRQIFKELNLDPKKVQPRRVHDAISRAKNELTDIETFVAESYFQEIIRRVLERYQQLLLANNALDFDDLLQYVVTLLEGDPNVRARYQARFQHILVDEFQDTNTAQYRLLSLLAGSQSDLFVVGDPDQSIYRWRGADYRNVRRFQENYPGAQTILLEQNYRSTQTILDVAMAVINRNIGRQKKELFTERGVGERVVLHEAYDENDEGSYVVETIAMLTLSEAYDPGDCAIMYRTNAQSRALEEAFLRANLPYRLVGAQRFYGRREVKDIIAYLRLIHNPMDQVSLLRVINTPPRGIGAKTIDQLLQTADALEHAPVQVLISLVEDPQAPEFDAFSGRARKSLLDLAEPLHRWLVEKDRVGLLDLMDAVISDIGYRQYLDDGTDEGLERWENLQELRRVAYDMGELDLTLFLEQVALVSDQDTLTEDQNAPTLLTLHSAKGLEFPVVFIIGLDDGALPHQRSFDDAESMAEERRLFYVGVTRAKDRLLLTRAFRRRMAGPSMLSEPSRFLLNLPPELIDGDLPGPHNWIETAYRQQTTWEAPHKKPIEPRFRAGMRVRHPVFGEGIVISTQLDFDDEEISIEFVDVGLKNLVASMANLEIMDDA